MAPQCGQPARASVRRALALLDLFSTDAPLWTVERMADALGTSAPTCYRYVRQLVSTGLLMRLGGAAYGLGPRIALLDYTIRQADPLLRAAVRVMQGLAQRTECDCVMTALYGEQILDVHREPGQGALHLAYGRGRPRPLFQGAAPKVILAAQPVRWQRKLFDTLGPQAAAAGMGGDWQAFRAALGAIAREGHYVSRGELEPQLSALAVPVPAVAGEPSKFALTLVTRADRFELLNVASLARHLADAAAEVADGLARQAGAPS